MSRVQSARDSTLSLPFSTACKTLSCGSSVASFTMEVHVTRNDNDSNSSSSRRRKTNTGIPATVFLPRAIGKYLRQSLRSGAAASEKRRGGGCGRWPSAAWHHKEIMEVGNNTWFADPDTIIGNRERLAHHYHFGLPFATLLGMLDNTFGSFLCFTSFTR